MRAALVQGDLLVWSLLVFVACIAVVAVAMWLIEEYEALMGRMQRSMEMPHPRMDQPPHAREQWPRDMMMDDTTPVLLGVQDRADNNRRD